MTSQYVVVDALDECDDRPCRSGRPAKYTKLEPRETPPCPNNNEENLGKKKVLLVMNFGYKCRRMSKYRNSVVDSYKRSRDSDLDNAESVLELPQSHS